MLRLRVVAGFRPVTKMLAMTGNPWETVKSFRGRLAALLCLLQGEVSLLYLLFFSWKWADDGVDRILKDDQTLWKGSCLFSEWETPTLCSCNISGEWLLDSEGSLLSVRMTGVGLERRQDLISALENCCCRASHAFVLLTVSWSL